jgi:hypothetical protein
VSTHLWIGEVILHRPTELEFRKLCFLVCFLMLKNTFF